MNTKIKILFLFFLFIFHSFNYLAQFQQINTNTKELLYDLSCIKGDIMVSAWRNFLVRSNDECKTQIPIAIPGPTNQIHLMSRIDTSNLYMSVFNPIQNSIYKSSNGGYSWKLKYTSQGSFNQCVDFFNKSDGMLTKDNELYLTQDSGATWVQKNFIYPSFFTCLRVFSDSIVCAGEVNYSVSYNRGNTWTPVWGFGADVSDFFSLNKDTVFAISYGGEFSKTTNKCKTWSNQIVIGLDSAFKIIFKSKNEGYAVGRDKNGYGKIAKTDDLGNTWTFFNTGIKTSLLNIVFLNDSIAFLSGTKGVLLRWNYRQTIFTGINQVNNKGLDFNIFPNPVNDKLYINLHGKLASHLVIANVIGEEVFKENDFGSPESIDIRSLPSGVYFLKVENEKGSGVRKFIKE